MSLPSNFLLQTNEKTVLDDLNKIEFNKIPIYIISKMSKKLVGIFYVSLKNLNEELSSFLEKIENEQLIEFKMDLENKDINEYSVQSNLSRVYSEQLSSNENEIENTNNDFYDENINEIKRDNKIKIDKLITQPINHSIKNKDFEYKKKIKRFIPSFFILSLNSLIKEYTESMRIRGTISSSITLDPFESADFTFQRNLSELQQHTFIEPQIEDYKEVNNYILKDKLLLLNLVERSAYFLNLLSDAQNEELIIIQEIEFGEIFINFENP